MAKVFDFAAMADMKHRQSEFDTYFEAAQSQRERA